MTEENFKNRFENGETKSTSTTRAFRNALKALIVLLSLPEKQKLNTQSTVVNEKVKMAKRQESVAYCEQ